MKAHVIVGAAVMVLGGAMVGAAGGPGQGPAAKAAIPTFTKDVAPILYKNCTGCHRPGEIGPMSLLTYVDVRPRAKDIRDKVGDGVMPPWHADKAHGKFANDRSLSDEDKSVLLRWANNGAPKGDPKDLPPAPTYVDGWTLGEPDAVIQMPVDYKVPADGFVEYEYFEIPTNFTEDKWVQSIEVRPGARAVVHHVIVTARPPQPERRPGGFTFARGMDIPKGQTGADGTAVKPADLKHGRAQSLFPAPQRLGVFIGGFAPGTSPFRFEPGSAVLIRAGSTVVLQMHYTTNGKEAVDRTKVGFTFAKQPPQREMRLGTLLNGQLKIPAGEKDYSISAEMTTLTDVTLRSLLPHTHLRGRSWEYSVIYPDGRSEVILSVPKYDFNWQTEYIFAEPLKLPKGTKIHAVAHYDNSAANKSNPDPTVDVAWGDQTWEEMMFTGYVYSVDGVKPGENFELQLGGRRGGQ
jgi:mono/diheme cytochrome c family protein